MVGMNKKFYKSFLAVIFLMIIMLFSAVSAVDGGDKEEEKTAYTYEELKEIALAGNLQIAIDSLDIEAKETALENAIDEARMLSDAYGKSAVLNNRIIREVKPFEAETALEVAKMAKVDNITNLELKVYKEYIKILLTREELKKENSLLNILNERYSIIKAKYDRGLVTRDEKDSALYNIDSKEVQISSIKKKLLSCDLELKLLLNMQLDEELLNIEGKIETLEFSIPDVEKKVEKSLLEDTEIYRKKRVMEAKKMTMELTSEIYKPGNITYDDNKIAYETAKMEYSEGRLNVEVDIKSKYNSLLNDKDKIGLAEAYEDLMENRLDNAIMKYESGLINREEYLMEKENYILSVYERLAAVCSYNINLMEFIKQRGYDN